MSDKLARRLKAALADHEMNGEQEAEYGEPCEAEESPSEYGADASAKSLAVAASGHSHSVALPAGYVTVGGGGANSNIVSSGSYTINGAYPSIIGNTYNVNMDDELVETLKNLRKSLQDRVLRLKDELTDLSDRYEAGERILQSSVQQIKDIDTSLSALEPVAVALDVPDDYEDIPF